MIDVNELISVNPEVCFGKPHIKEFLRVIVL